MPETADRLLTLTAQIAAAYVGANAVDLAAMPGLIRDIQRSLTDLQPRHVGDRAESRSSASETRSTVQPAVEIRKSVFADHLVCLEDGKTFRTLRRHLGEKHRMTPEQYRAKWDLPESYPMIAPEYAKRRSVLSGQIRREKRR